jgi:hypothetical protein
VRPLLLLAAAAAAQEPMSERGWPELPA